MLVAGQWAVHHEALTVGADLPFTIKLLPEASHNLVSSSWPIVKAFAQ